MNIIRAQGSRRRDMTPGAPKLDSPTSPAKAGIQQALIWIPAFAGMVGKGPRVSAEKGGYPARAKGSSPESRMAVSRVVIARGATPSIAFAKASI